MVKLLREPSALLPLGLGLAALLLVVGHAAVYGIVHEADEGAAAHIFHLLMAGQLPAVGYFLVRWIPRAPRAAAGVMALDGAIVVLAWAAVYWLT